VSCANKIKKYISRSLSHTFLVLESCLFLEENLVPFIIEEENPDKEQLINMDPDD